MRRLYVLTDAIVTTDDTCYEMVGLIPGQVRMQTKLAALGYREVTGKPGNFYLKAIYKLKAMNFIIQSFIQRKSFRLPMIQKGCEE